MHPGVKFAGKLAAHPLVSQLANQVMGVKQPSPSHSKVRFVLLGLAGFGLLTGAGFLVTAFYLWAVLYMVPPLAALATAGFVWLVALLFILSAYLLKYMQEKRAQRAKSRAIGEVQATVKGLAHDVQKSLANHPNQALIAALAAGFATGKKLF